MFSPKAGSFAVAVPVSLFLLLFTANPAQSQSFVETQDWVVPQIGGGGFTESGAAQPSNGVRVGDVNGDGLVDLLWADSSTQRGTFLNDPATRQFLPSVGWEVPIIGNGGFTESSGDSSNGIEVGDVNGDGYDDLLWADGATQRGTFLNDGAGGWIATSAWTVPVVGSGGFTESNGSGSNGLLVGDANGDGFADLLWADGNSQRGTYLNDQTGGWQIDRRWEVPLIGSGGFTESSGSGSNGVCLGDVNADGFVDLLWADGATQRGVFLNDPSTGTFVETSEWVIPVVSSGGFTEADGIGNNALQLGDVDGDGQVDLLHADGGLPEQHRTWLNDIEVCAPPVISSQPVSAAACPGDSVTLTVVAEGCPPLTYQWRRNGMNLAGATSASLDLDPIQRTDEGTYDVVVTNPEGSTASQPAPLTVGWIDLLQQPSGVRVCAGSTVVLAVQATSPLPLTYQWKRDGTDLALETESTLTLPDITPESEATSPGYTCQIQSSCGNIVMSEAASVVVDLAPTITGQPVDANVCPGGTHTFTVTAISPRPVTYQWFKDDVAIPLATANSLTVSSASVSDQGSYRVEVSSECGTEISTEALLGILEAPMITMQPPSTLEACSTGMSSLHVVAVGSSPLSYQWRHNSTPIPGANQASYVPTISGLYDVVISNPCGSTTSEGSNVVLGSGPTISQHPQSQSPCESGADVVFTVTASGTGTLDYQWRKDGIGIPGARSSTLSVTPVRSNEGIYDVVVGDDCGQMSSAGASLTVRSRPDIEQNPVAPEFVCLGDTFVLSVVASGNPPLSYLWTKDGQTLSTSEASLTISNFASTDSGSYHVRVSNPCGSRWSAPVHLGSVPLPEIQSPPQRLFLCPGEDALFTVEASSSQGPVTYQWMRNGIPIANATESTYTLAGVTPADDGAVFSVRVSNACGASRDSSPASLSVEDAPPTLTSSNPASGTYLGGTAVTLSGNGFCTGARVFFGEREAASVVILPPNRLIAESPESFPRDCETTFSVSIQVRTEIGEATLADAFTIGPARTLHVGEPQAPPGSGTSLDPYSSIQTAIDAASDGDAVLIDPDTTRVPDYAENFDSRGKKIVITSLDPHRPPTIESAAGPGSQQRILTIGSGEGPETVIACLVLLSGRGGVLISSGSSPTLYDLTIHDQGSDTNPVSGDGAGILVQGGSSPRIEKCRVHTNWAAGNGAGVAVLDPGSAPTLISNEVYSNRTGGLGAGIYVGPDSTVTRIQGNDIHDNVALTMGGGVYIGADFGSNTVRDFVENEVRANLGGGVVLQAGVTAVLRDNAIVNNQQNSQFLPHGGGIACDGSLARTTLTISNNSIENNQALGPCALGGGLYLRANQGASMSALIEGNVICGNQSQVGAGIGLDTKVEAIIKRNVIAFNQVGIFATAEEGEEEPDCPWQDPNAPPEHFGAGLFERDCGVALINNTFHGNLGAMPDSGSGIHGLVGFYEPDSMIINNIISENTEYGLALIGTGTGDLPVRNNAFYDNGQGDCFGTCPLGWQFDNLQTVNPDYLNESLCDRLFLRETSGLRDQGESVFPHIALPDDGLVDLGALEYTPLQKSLDGTARDTNDQIIDLLSVNNSSGGIDRTLVLDEGQDMFLTILNPQRGNGTYVIHAHFGAPTDATGAELPFNVGCLGFPILLGSPYPPSAIWNNLGRPLLVGESQDFSGLLIADPPLAPTTFPLESAGSRYHPPAGTEVFLQGVVIDRNSIADRPASITNGVLIRIR